MEAFGENIGEYICSCHRHRWWSAEQQWAPQLNLLISPLSRNLRLIVMWAHMYLDIHVRNYMNRKNIPVHTHVCLRDENKIIYQSLSSLRYDGRRWWSPFTWRWGRAKHSDFYNRDSEAVEAQQNLCSPHALGGTQQLCTHAGIDHPGHPPSSVCRQVVSPPWQNSHKILNY